MTHTIIGIDPGLSGAVAAYMPEIGWQVWDTPVATVKGSRRDYLTAEMRRILVSVPNPVAALERGIAMPRQSSSTTYTTGRGGGLWEGILAGLGIPYELVEPAKWKRAMGLTGQDKGGSRVLAQRLFPEIAEQFARVKDDGRAEACLIAEWRRRQWYG